jgi:putative lipoic acid-binding regulatory protein
MAAIALNSMSMETTMTIPPEQSLIEYPTDFPIKVMGSNVDGFADAILHVARSFDPGFDATTLEVRPSKGNKYLGLTVTVRVTDREQLDELYRTLSSHPMVKVVL